MRVSEGVYKLRKMSRAEMRTRLAELWRQQRERRLHRRGSAAQMRRAAAPFDAAGLRDGAAALVPGTRRDEINRLEKDFPAMFASLASRAGCGAERVLSGRWELLGHPVDLRKNPDWRRDPRSDYRWPRAFYADLSLHLDSKDGVDVKYVCELGRQQYLVELARGWLFTQEGKYAERARGLMLDWIRCNPLYEGVHWSCALEVAIRAVSWLWTIATLAEWDGWQTEDMKLVAAGLADHATYLEHHLSFYSSPYNHLIGEATGLYLIGLALAQFGDAGRWRRLARKVLTEYGPRQFYGDGFCVEQATGYHFYTLGFLSLAVVASRAEGDPLEGLEPVVHQAYRAGAALRGPDGRWPAIGDVDSARSIPVFHKDFWDFTSLCSLGAALFDDRELKLSSTDPGEEVYWLLGCEGVASWERLAENNSPTCAVLEESGYAVARREGDWLLFDAGPVAEGLHADATPSTAHGHADTLQVLFQLAGKPVLIDPGMPFYCGSPQWVGHFRSPAAHNTLEIEGVSVARPVGRLDWSHVAPRPRLDANLSDEVWLARGRAEWACGVVVERYLLGLPTHGIWIADWIETDRPRRVRWFWQLPTETVRRAESTSSHACVVEGEGIALATWSASVPIHARIERAAQNSAVAWNAPGYGMLSAGQRVCHEAEGASRFLVLTYIGSLPTQMEVAVRGRHLRCATSSKNEVSLNQEHEYLCDADALEAEIVWHVSTERELLTYAAGTSACPAGPGWTYLKGKGDWPAMYTVRVISPAA